MPMGIYERKLRPLEERFWEKVDKAGPDDCWLWNAGRTVFGYGAIGSKGRGKILLAHRVSWELANGPIPDGLHCLHRCDNPPCVNPAHIFLGTQTDNNADMRAKGRAGHGDVKGSAVRTSKLTEDEVIRIRALSPALSFKTLGAMFGVTPQNISHIVNRRWWRHI